MDDAHDLLNTAAGCAHNTDAAAAGFAAKADRCAINKGEAAVGAHHEQFVRFSILLQLHFLLQRYVIREHEHVHALLERVHALLRGILASHRNRGQIEPGIRTFGFSNGFAAGGVLLLLLFHEFQELLVGLFSCFVIFRCDADHHIVHACRCTRFIRNTQLLHSVLVERRTHASRNLDDTRHLAQFGGDAHQENGIVVLFLLDETLTTICIHSCLIVIPDCFWKSKC